MLHKLLHPSRLFAAFKYAVYACLVVNLWLFFREDAGSAEIWGAAGGSPLELVEAFAQTIDTLAWVTLLLLFELETSVLPDETLRRRAVRWTLHGLRGLAALVVLNSVVGYWGKLDHYLGAQPFAREACSVADGGWSNLDAHDEFSPLDPQNCALLAAPLWSLPGSQVLSSAPVLEAAQRLAWVDVINAVAWIFVVVLLEFDVRMQLRGRLHGWVLRISTGLKVLTYATLLLAAVYWGLEGDFLDFWDAFLWLVAFVFIEMNLFQWQEEEDRIAHRPIVHAT